MLRFPRNDKGRIMFAKTEGKRARRGYLPRSDNDVAL